MRCPQCQRENQFPVPGLCPECYKQWKEEMRARFGPGPWPSQPVSALKDQAVGDGGDAGQPDTEEQQAGGDAPCSGVERSLVAVLERLRESDGGDQEFLLQLDLFLQEVARLVAQR